MKPTGEEQAGQASAGGAVQRLASAVVPVLQKTGALFPLFVLMLLYFSFTTEFFFTERNFGTVTTQGVYFTMVVIAQAIVMISGGFDLSVGSNVSLTSIITAMVVTSVAGPEGIVLAVTLGLLTGTAVGAANGLVVAIFRVSPLIVTLAMASVVSGIALIITGGGPIFNLPLAFRESLYTGTLLGVRIPWLLALLVILVAYVALYWHRFGRNLYAVGGNPVSAHIAGVPVRWTLFLSYTLAGFLVGLSAVLLTARVGSGEPNLGGQLALESIAAAVLGGISLRGGQGVLWGAVLGAIFLIMLRNGLDLSGVSSYMQMVITGILLILAIVVDRYLVMKSA